MFPLRPVAEEINPVKLKRIQFFVRDDPRQERWGYIDALSLITVQPSLPGPLSKSIFKGME